MFELINIIIKNYLVNNKWFTIIFFGKFNIKNIIKLKKMLS
jgi:hypothetical protein